ncbi:serine hydrolase [Streptomyces sp. NPDC001492]
MTCHGRRVVDLWAGEGIDGSSPTGLFSITRDAAHLVLALLEHRAGPVGIPDGGFSTEELADDRLMAARPTGQKPLWDPESGYGYHGLVIGALTGEVVRRATGKSIQ